MKHKPTTQTVTRDTNEVLKKLTEFSGAPATRILESLVYQEYQAVIAGKPAVYLRPDGTVVLKGEHGRTYTFTGDKDAEPYTSCDPEVAGTRAAGAKND